MRMSASDGPSEEGEKAGGWLFAGLVLPLRGGNVAQRLPGPLPVSPTFLHREGAAVVGIGEDILYSHARLATMSDVRRWPLCRAC